MIEPEHQMRHPDRAAQARAIGARLLETYDRLVLDLPLWSDINDTERLRDLLDPIEGLVAAIAELVPDYLDAHTPPLSEHALRCLRSEINAARNLNGPRLTRDAPPPTTTTQD